MFSGLINTIGVILRNTGSEVVVAAKVAKPRLGESIAINGICLTVVSFQKHKMGWKLVFDASEETIEKTTLSRLKVGEAVHVEPALKASDSLGGHIVQGHVDGVGKLIKIQKLPSSHVVTLEAPNDVAPYLVTKGSVTVDGISLTVVDIKRNKFTVAIIPYTWIHTTLHQKKVNDEVNLEADIMAKYVARYIKR